MSQHARKQKQMLRTSRREARQFYESWRDKPEVVRLHENANKQAARAALPDGYELISGKREVSFRLPLAGEKFINSDGHVDIAAYPWEAHAFGHGPRWIIRKRRADSANAQNSTDAPKP
jgi:hypothetical protein